MKWEPFDYLIFLFSFPTAIILAMYLGRLFMYRSWEMHKPYEERLKKGI